MSKLKWIWIIEFAKTLVTDVICRGTFLNNYFFPFFVHVFPEMSAKIFIIICRIVVILQLDNVNTKSSHPIDIVSRIFIW